MQLIATSLLLKTWRLQAHTICRIRIPLLGLSTKKASLAGYTCTLKERVQIHLFEHTVQKRKKWRFISYLAEVDANEFNMPSILRWDGRVVVYSCKFEHIWKLCSSPCSWSQQSSKIELRRLREYNEVPSQQQQFFNKCYEEWLPQEHASRCERDALNLLRRLQVQQAYNVLLSALNQKKYSLSR